MAACGYYSHPALHGDTLAFVCEESAWVVDARGGVPRRLTSVPGCVTALSLSPDGSLLALSVAGAGFEEVYCCSAAGGAAQRLTHVGARCARVAAWTPDAGRVLFACDARAGASGGTELWWVPAGGGAATPAGAPGGPGLGPACAAAFQPGGTGRALGRHTRDPATSEWKRYGGGRAGELWVDAAGGGAYSCVLDAPKLRSALGAPPDADAAPGGIQQDGGGSLGAPAWAAGGRIAFAADPGGAAGVYSCSADGADVRCHVTAGALGGFYPRHVAADGRPGAPPRVAFAAGGRLWVSLLDGDCDSSLAEVRVDWRGPRAGRAVRFCDAEEELESAALHPEGVSLAVVCRGRAFALGLWAGPALAFPPAGGADASADADAGDADWGRARLACWLFDGARVAFACDAGGDDDIEVHHAAAGRAAGTGAALRLPQPALGRPEEVVASPQAPLLAVVNHRGELLIVDVETRTLRRADVASHAGGLGECVWSPCGCWLAYSASTGPDTAALRLLDVRSGAVHAASAPLRRDGSPAWDPAGRYLYFISARDFEPHYDEAERVGLGFPHAARPYVLTLQADTPSPLLPELRAPGDDDDDGGGGEGDDGGWEDGEEGDGDEEQPPEPIVIDLEGLVDRAVALPVPVGRYGQVLALDRDRLMFTAFPVHTPAVGLAGDDEDDEDDAEAATGALLRFDLRTLREVTLVGSGVDDVALSMDGRTMAVQYGGAHRELRVLRAGEKPREEDDDEQPVDPDRPGPDSGLVDIGGRVRLEVHPGAEWRQMLREVWRRLRDDFWDADMGGVDWPACLARYEALLPRCACRAEVGDVLAEMVAELGCSHAWVSTGDPGAARGAHCPARLGADCVWDAAEGGYRVTALLRGDAWDARRGGPLAKPGVGIAVGDILLAIDRVPLTPRRSPDVALVCAAGAEVLLSFRPGAAGALAALRLDARRSKGSSKDAKSKKSKGAASKAPKAARVRHVRVKPLSDDADCRYRDGVAAATSAAHALGGGCVGYVAVPDMERLGFAEFTRSFASEARRGALLLDLRGNGGGHVSELLLARLAQRQLGFELPRWGAPEAYPSAARAGPLVLLVDEGTASDGEVAAWAFRATAMGPIVGARTWGGVVGNDAYADLVDGSQLAVPQVSIVLGPSQDDAAGAAAANGIENRGVEPDIAVRVSPQDYAAGRDPQLQAAVLEALRLLALQPPMALPKACRERVDAAAAASLAAAEPSDWPFDVWAPIADDDSDEEEEEEEDEPALRPRRRQGGGGARH
jgi:tricorn protease-like protein/C-terminal processing protease CtpA/Prc